MRQNKSYVQCQLVYRMIGRKAKSGFLLPIMIVSPGEANDESLAETSIEKKLRTEGREQNSSWRELEAQCPRKGGEPAIYTWSHKTQ